MGQTPAEGRSRSRRHGTISDSGNSTHGSAKGACLVGGASVLIQVPIEAGEHGFEMTDCRTSLLLFLLMATLLVILPVRHLSDSRYSLLISRQLLFSGTLRLDGVMDHPEFFKRPESRAPSGSDPRLPYQMMRVGGHILPAFPIGTPILSVPYAAFMELVGLPVVHPNGSYDPRRERWGQAILASWTVAGFSVMVFWSARLLLPRWWSLLIAVAATLGTPVLSTASRVMWSQTTLLLLLAATLHLLLILETRPAHGHPFLVGGTLASLLAWAYLSRPTAVVFIVAVTIFLALRHKAVLTVFVPTGMAWGLLFVGWSWREFGTWLPPYYSATRLEFGHFPEAILGHLLSPARGLLVYSPMVFLTAWLLVRCWSRVVLRTLVGVLLAATGAHLLVVSGFGHWWGGHCYGPRLMADVVPGLALVTIVALKAWLDEVPTSSAARGVADSRAETVRFPCSAVLSVLLILWSVGLHAIPCVNGPSTAWNSTPTDIDQVPSRLWDWSDPPFLRLFR